MNEYSILIHLLTQKRENSSLKNTEILGATQKEICKKLKFTGKSASIRFYSLLEEVSKNLRAFGLHIQKNPLNNHWFITQDSEIQEFSQANPFHDKPKLAATLCAVLAVSLTQASSVSVDQVKEVRKKKNLMNDLKALEKMKFIILSENQILIHPNIGYFLNIDQFIELLEKRAKITDFERNIDKNKDKES